MNELRLLTWSIALAEHRNFARAAEALHISQPNLSRGIAALERAMGVPLFDRTRKGAIPTPFGSMLLEHAARVVRGQASLRRELQLMAGLDAGELRVRTSPNPSEISVAPAIARLMRAHPRLRVRCTVAEPREVLRDVLEERVDVGIAHLPESTPDPRIVVEKFPPMRLFFACRVGHPLTREPRPSFARVYEFPHAASILHGALAAAVHHRDPNRSTPDPRVSEVIPQLVVDSPAVAREIARGSDVVIVGSAGMLADDVAAGRLAMLDVEAPILRTLYSVHYLHDRTLAPAARAFIETMRVVEAEARAAEAAIAPTLAAKRRRAARGR